MCHIILAVPLLALALFAFLPVGQALMLYLAILLVCSVFYWIIWRDARRPVTLGVEGLIGGMAQVTENGATGVKVFYRGEIWDAICEEPVSRDEKVQITGMERMKLIVRKRHVSTAQRHAH
jgi:membrane protein implicated in regulation of membrane protease activity